MSLIDKDPSRARIDHRLLLAYITDLELEVDRLRTQDRFIRHELKEVTKKIHEFCNSTGAGEQSRLTGIDRTLNDLTEVVRDAHDASGYHPGKDQVVAIAVRPLIEKVFRWQQRLQNAPKVELRLRLETEHMDWFPARLRHILDNLLSNALKYRDPDKAEAWVALALRSQQDRYELSISDNGVGLPSGGDAPVLDLFYRAAPARVATLGVGLAAVKLLVVQSGGSLTVNSDEGQGSTFIAVLPKFDVDDFLI